VNSAADEVYTQFAVYGTTNIHPIAVVFMLCMAGLVLRARRSTALFAVLLVCVFMPTMQRIVIGGLDFGMIRLIMIAAWARVVVRREYRGFKPGKFDLIFVLWTASLGIVYVLNVGPSGIVTRLGASFDALTVFFLFRVLVRTREQVFLLARQLAWIAIALGVCLAYEMTMRSNLFVDFGSAPPTPRVRDGKVRSQGPFSHAIMAGTFGAALLPIFIAVFRGRKKGRALMASAILSTAVIAVASGSTGPLITLGVGVMGWGLWPLRKQMRLILGALAGMAVFIHLVRERPIWHLIGRLSSMTGGTGYHRYRLIDAFVAHFGDWALIGASDAGSWGTGLQDTTNYYIRQGIYGGLLTLVLFVLLLGSSFSRLRRTRGITERAEGPKSLWTQLPWGFSVVLAAHCVTFISASYFGQMELFLFAFLALIPSLARFRRPVGQVATSSPSRPPASSRRRGSDSRGVGTAAYQVRDS
jgi:hypothetical protein